MMFWKSGPERDLDKIVEKVSVACERFSKACLLYTSDAADE